MENNIEEVEVEILPNTECKELVATGEIIEDDDTMEKVLHDADAKNSEHRRKT